MLLSYIAHILCFKYKLYYKHVSLFLLQPQPDRHVKNQNQNMLWSLKRNDSELGI